MDLRLPAALLLPLPLSFCSPDPGAPADGAVPEYAIEDFMDSVDYSGASFSPDGSRILVSHNGSGIYNAYAVAADGGGEERLTHSTTDAILALSWFPDDERFLYTSDRGGDELNHVYVRETDGGVVDLTPGENLKAQFAGWSGDYRSFHIQTNERDPRFFDVYRYQVAEGYPREMVYRNDEGFFPGGLSPDGRWLALVEVRTTNDSNLYAQDLVDGRRVDVTPHDGNVNSAPSDFSPDSRWLYYTTDQDSEFQHLMRHELATGRKERVLSMDWDVSYGVFSRGGGYLTVAANVDARTELALYDADTMEPVEAPRVDGADLTFAVFSRDDARMAVYGSGSRFPSDLFVHEVGGGGPARRLTRSLNADIDPGHLAEAETVRFASYDGVEIPGLLYVPRGASAEAPAPALVWVHGGPGGQTRVGYSALIQYLVNHGYAVYGINNRGSSGYGKTFYAMDDRRHGEADLGDVVAAKRMLIDTGAVDPGRVGVIGGSYGGYMVAAALAFEPEVFDVGVNIFGVTNWVRTLESIPPWWEAQREALYAELGDPATDRERLERISPLFHAENIVKPMIVLQGANDPRVLQVESDELVAAVRRNGVPVDYRVYPDEGHGFVNRENEIDGYRAIREFLDRHL